eukprot:3544637-Rhodomonas_salina.1
MAGNLCFAFVVLSSILKHFNVRKRESYAVGKHITRTRMSTETETETETMACGQHQARPIPTHCHVTVSTTFQHVYPAI